MSGEYSYRRFCGGDDEGMADIVREYKDGLILYLRSFVSDIYTAEDLAEETFFRIMVKKPKYSGKSSFRSWLYAIGRNAAVDYVRHHSKELYIPTWDMESYISDEEDIESAYIREKQQEIINKALKGLSADYRQVIWLVFFEGMSNAEAAAVMGKNSRQMRNLLYRAKQSLKKELEKEDFIYEEF